MTNKKITDLPSALTAGVTDEVEIVQGGVSKRVTIARFLGVTFPFAPAPLSTISPVMASKLVGRGSAAGAGVLQEITLGTGLTMVGTTLNASGGSTSFGNGWNWGTTSNNVFFSAPLSTNTYMSISDDVINGVGISIASNTGMRVDTATGGLLVTANNSSLLVIPDAETQLQGVGLLLGFSGASAGQPNWGWHSPSDGTLSWSTYDDNAIPVETFMSISRTGTAVTDIQLSAGNSVVDIGATSGLNITAATGTPIALAGFTAGILGHTTVDIVASTNQLSLVGGTGASLQGATNALVTTQLGEAFLQAHSNGILDLSASTDINIITSTQSTVGAAGGASALPATPSGYVHFKINGANFQMPYYLRA